jgi:hypothetical protein
VTGPVLFPLHFAAVSQVSEQPADPHVVWQSVPAAHMHAALLQVQPAPEQVVPAGELLAQAPTENVSRAISKPPTRLELNALNGNPDVQATGLFACVMGVGAPPRPRRLKTRPLCTSTRNRTTVFLRDLEHPGVAR